ncbi:MAG: hypothetical protein JXR42_04350 [Gammaproteobacteria bacterium]|nr:hypothetical protein [Gammaproteobacteria bacterium]
MSTSDTATNAKRLLQQLRITRKGLRAKRKELLATATSDEETVFDKPWFRLGFSSSSLTGEGAIILGIGFLIVSVPISIILACKKALKSLRNIFNGRKVLRSMFSLACIGGGVYGGILLGVALAAAVLGTAALTWPAALIIGITAVLCAGISTLLGKKIGRALRRLFSSNKENILYYTAKAQKESRLIISIETRLSSAKEPLLPTIENTRLKAVHRRLNRMDTFFESQGYEHLSDDRREKYVNELQLN